MRILRGWMQRRRRAERFKMFTIERTTENHGDLAEIKVISVTR